MERNHLVCQALALALVLMLVGPATGWARTEIVSLGGTACCLDMGLRLAVSVEDGSLRCALELTGREFATVTLGAKDAVRWGVPIVSIVTELQNARTDRLDTSRGTERTR